MVEAADVLQCLTQRIFACVTEGRMAKVMSEAERFGQILIESENTRDGPADLRHFDAVRQPHSEMVPIGRNEDLSLVAKPSEGDGMDDPVAVALKDVARPAWAIVHLRINPAARLRWLRGQVPE
jgi:hypothetical protein